MNAIEKEVLKTIGENVESPDVFTDTVTGMEDIRDSISSAIMEMCMVTGSVRKGYYLPLEHGQFLYQMDFGTDYFGYVVEAWSRLRHYRLEQTDLLTLAHTDPGWMRSDGDATHYYHIGYKLFGVYRVPPSSGDVLELQCVVIPKPYTGGTDLIKVRANYQRGCVYYALSEFYASRGDARRATDYYNEYIAVANLMRIKPQQTDKVYGGKP